MAIWNRLTAFVTGGAVATAAADAVKPELEPLAQTAWKNAPHKVLDPGTAAALRARSTVTGTPGIDLQGVNLDDDSARSGVGSNRFDLLTELARTEPGVGELIRLRRRNQATEGASGISDPELTELLRRSGYTADNVKAIRSLVNDFLSPDELANAIQQGFVPNNGVLPPDPQQAPPYTPPTETVPIDPVLTALDGGASLDELKVKTQLAGNPPGPQELLTMWNRHIITETAVEHGIREGRTKSKWIPALKELHKAVLSATEYANLYVRAWIKKEEMYAGGALSGYSQEQMDLLYKNRGRPIATVQAFNAWSRKAPHPDIPDEPKRPGTFDYEDFEEAIRRSDVQTWYAPILWKLRWNYPPLFQLGRLAQAGAITRERAEEILQIERYEQQDIDALLKFWYGGAKAATSDPWVTKAQTQFWNTVHSSFKDGLTGDAEARDDLSQLGLSADSIAQVIQLWKWEAETYRKQLTPTQVKKAYKKPLTNPATGAPWTRQDAIDRLIAMGWSFNDADTFLSE